MFLWLLGFIAVCWCGKWIKLTKALKQNPTLATHYEAMKILVPISEELIAEWTPVAQIQELLPVSSRCSDSSFQTMMWAVCIFPTLPQMGRWDDSLGGLPKLERWTYICVNNHPGQPGERQNVKGTQSLMYAFGLYT